MKKKTLLGLVLVTIICLFPLNEIHAFEWPINLATLQCRDCGGRNTKAHSEYTWELYEYNPCTHGYNGVSDEIYAKIHTTWYECLSCGYQSNKNYTNTYEFKRVHAG